METILNSREWAKFKRLFIGPIMPRRIRKLRREENLPKAIPGNGVKKLFVDNTDCRKNWDRTDVHRLAKPIWANDAAIKEIYAAGRELNKLSDIRYEVDHIIPIRHPLVCGLHVENNLQILPQRENREKSNSFIVS